MADNSTNGRSAESSRVASGSGRYRRDRGAPAFSRGEVTTLPEQVARYAQELRAMLGDGMLAGLGSIGLGDGVTVPLDRAVRVALSDLDDLTREASDGLAVDGSRWQQLGDDLARLRRFATSGP